MKVAGVEGFGLVEDLGRVGGSGEALEVAGGIESGAGLVAVAWNLDDGGDCGGEVLWVVAGVFEAGCSAGACDGDDVSGDRRADEAEVGKPAISRGLFSRDIRERRWSDGRLKASARPSPAGMDELTGRSVLRLELGS